MRQFIASAFIGLTVIPLSIQFVPSSFKPKSTHLYSVNEKNPKSPYEFHIAPMQCYTNLPLRRFLNLLSPSSILWTEMEKVNDILESSTDTHANTQNQNDSLVHAWSKRLGSPLDDHSNLVLQHYNTLRGVNLNCGCPSIESGGASYYGASLMKDAELTGKLVHAMKESIVEFKKYTFFT